MTDKKTAPAFMIDAPATIKWPVIVNLPVDGGEVAAYQFTGVFKRMTEKDLDALLGDGAGRDDVGDDPKRMQAVLAENAELLPRLLTGWEGVTDAAGNAVAFGEDVLKAQILGVNGKFLSIGLWCAIAEIRNGARLGN